MTLRDMSKSKSWTATLDSPARGKCLAWELLPGGIGSLNSPYLLNQLLRLSDVAFGQLKRSLKFNGWTNQHFEVLAEIRRTTK